VEGECEVGDVGNDGFDSVSPSFDFPHDGGHLVAVGWVFHGVDSGDVNGSSRHFDCSFSSFVSNLRLIICIDFCSVLYCRGTQSLRG